jgi:LysM repeat protein
MENDSISSSSSESKAPLIVAILGFAIGVFGLVIGFKAKSAAEAATAAAATATSNVEALNTTVVGKADKSEVANIASDLAATKAAVEKNEADLLAQIVALQKVASAPKAAAGAGKSAAPAGPGEYVVAKGDNLGSIAKKAGISLKAILDLNPGVNANRLQIGQKLKTK